MPIYETRGTSAEVVAARVPYSTLSQRLDSLERGVNVVDYFEVGDADYNPAFGRAITAAAVNRDVLFLPPGTFDISATIPWSKLIGGLVGSGMGSSIIRMTGTCASAIELGGSLVAPIADQVFADFEIDGSGTSEVNSKGIYLTYLQRVTFRRVYIHDVPASGFGVDFLRDTTFDDCYAEGCGRLGTTASPGCSGFGLGTGMSEVENVTLVNCTARDNTRYGVFFERLGATTYNSKGAKVIGGSFEGNYRGIGDNGSTELLVEGAHVRANVDAGVYVGVDQAVTTIGGIGGAIAACVITENGLHGIYLDATVGSVERYTVRGNQLRANVVCGVQLLASATNASNVIADNDIYLNGASGVVVSGGTHVNTSVSGNRIWSNGRTHATSKFGIDVGVGTHTRPTIKDNICSDPDAAPTQTYGIQVKGSVTLTGGVIRGNNLEGNVTGGLSLLSTPAVSATGTVIADNRGYNPIGWDALAPGASPWAYRAGPGREVIRLLNGTVSNVAVLDRTGTSTNVALAAPASIQLEPYDTMTVTYSVSPNAKRLRT